jgi:hypothetical protein
LGCWFLRSCLQYYYPPLKVWDHPSTYLSGALSFLFILWHYAFVCSRQSSRGWNHHGPWWDREKRFISGKRRERWERVPTDFSKSSVPSSFFRSPKSLLESSSLSISFWLFGLFASEMPCSPPPFFY